MPHIEIHPLTRNPWRDFEKLIGPGSGAHGIRRYTLPPTTNGQPH